MKKFYSTFKVKLSVLIILTFLSISVTAQRTIPYPIIFVHGWVGSDKTWYGMGVHLKDNGLNVSLDDNRRGAGSGSIINFHLNADGTTNTSKLSRYTGGPYYGDVFDYNSYINPSNDVFFINFDNPFSNGSKSYSNEAAAAKQGFAVGLAIKKVLNATGAKKVILFGHSMGGLAIREYLQNTENWQFGYHNVAKLITTGTPHGGSNANSVNILPYIGGGNETSEAVRDLRYPKTSSIYDRGVYLFGGDENNINRLGNNYFNNDVDCNGSLNYVNGLNYKNLYSDISYSCIIGTGGNFFLSTTGTSGDDIVDGDKASIFNLGYNNLKGGTFYAIKSFEESGASNYYTPNDYTWHTKLPKQRWINTYALDEPNEISMAYEIEPEIAYRGFFTPQASGSLNDTDIFKIFLPSKGVLGLAFNSSEGSIGLYDSNNNILLNQNNGSEKVTVENGGNYYLIVKGAAGNNSSTWEFRTYSFATSFCALPSAPYLYTNENTTFCEGNSSTLITDSNFSGYKWFKDGQEIDNNLSQLIAKETGNYTVQGTQCGVSINSTNSINIQVNPIPNKPNISKEELPDKFVLTSSSYENLEWYFNGNLLYDEKSQTLTPQELGNYKVKVIKDGCSNISDDVLIKMDKPTLILDGKSTGCEGDSLKIKTQPNFSNYTFSDGKSEINSLKNEAYLKKSGSYSVVAHRGKFSSPPSDPININIYPFPQKPILMLENFGLKSSSGSNNQWLINGVELKDSTNQYIKISGADNFQVKVTENGCSSFSDKFQILAEEKNLLKESNLKIFPNPNNGIFEFEFYSFDFQPVVINIYDTFGKSIYHKTIKIVGRYSDKINIVNKPAGQYYLTLQKGNSENTVKFVKN